MLLIQPHVRITQICSAREILALYLSTTTHLVELMYELNCLPCCCFGNLLDARVQPGEIASLNLQEKIENSFFNAMSIVLGIISCVYKRMLSVNTVELSHFTTGETVNFMSTDVDRVGTCSVLTFSLQ